MSFVYFIQAGEGNNAPIKIGVAKDVKKRLDIMQVGNHKELIILAAIKADSDLHAYWLEKSLHKFFKTDRIRGEWFKNVNMKKAEAICSTKPFARQGKNSRRKELRRDEEAGLA